MASPDDDQQANANGAPTEASNFFKALLGKSCAEAIKVVEKTKKLGEDDPRRITHSLKVGLAVTLVSLLYCYKPFYDAIGVNAMWAVLTVVVIFEFSVGATFGKGINRMIGTLAGGALGVGAASLATLTGSTTGEPILVSIFVFVIAATVTFLRFSPTLKAKYDYGLMIFIMTFSLISVSGYQANEVLLMAQDRVSMIIIGCCVTIFVSICIYPVWIGEDLHNLVSDNMDKLGKFLEGFGGEYFRLSQDEKSNEDKSFLQEYISVLSSENSEKTMANLAKWEPSHGRFKFGHPWKQYLKVGTLTRQCAYKIHALNCCLKSDIQISLEIQSKIQEMCTEISTESGKALKELASRTKKMTRAKSANLHIARAKKAAEKLKAKLKANLLREEEEAIIMLLEEEIVPVVATVSFMLMEVVKCTEKIAEAVHELASLSAFKRGDAVVSPEEDPSFIHPETVQCVSSTMDVRNHVITVVE